MMRTGTQFVFRAVLICCAGLSARGAATTAPAGEQQKLPWNIEALSKAPIVHPAPDFQADDVKAIFYDGLPWKGKPTRVFAWYGVPKTAPGEKVPAMVLIHGGGGTAFEDWVRLWVKRGYAAIAMDTCGCTGRQGKRMPHPDGGPDGWGGFKQIDEPIQDQWSYHAVADVILAHSLVRSFPEVDAKRTGVTGISWGGYLTCIVAGIDPRFQFAVPVYGCGFLTENSAWLEIFQRLGSEKAARWSGLWDPSHYLKRARMPMLWVTGTNDFAYPMDSLQKSYRSARGPRTLCIRLRMPHGHGGAGENPEEIHVFADSILKQEKPLARITGRGQDEQQAWVTFEARVPIVKAQLCFTTDRGIWKERKWETIDAVLDATTGRVHATIPPTATVYYFNLTDARHSVVSSEHQER